MSIYLPHGIEPYSDWKAGDEVVVWGSPRYSGYYYKGPSMPIEIRTVERLTRTLVILADHSRWKRESGAVAGKRIDFSTGPTRCITPVTEERRAEVKRLNLVVRVMNLADKADYSKMSTEELITVGDVLSKHKRVERSP